MAESDGNNVTREEHGNEAAATAVAATPLELKPAASSSLPRPATAAMTALHPAAAVAPAANYNYNRPFPFPPPHHPPFHYNTMPYTSRPATSLSMMTMMPPPTAMKMNMPPVPLASKATTISSKRGGKKPITTKKQRLSSTAKTTLTAKVIGSSSSSSITPADKVKVALPSSSYAPYSVPSSTTRTAACKLSDTEFAKFVASEFKRRGYIAAIQLKLFSPGEMDTGKGSASKKRRGMQNDDSNKVNEDGKEVEVTKTIESARTSASSSSSSSAAETTIAAATATTANGGCTQTRKKISKRSQAPSRKSEPPPSPSLSLPSFSFYPSISTPNSKQAATWEAMYDQLCDYVKNHDGKLPLSLTTMSTTTTMEETADDSAAMTDTTTPPVQPGATTNTNTPAATTTFNINTTNKGDAETKIKNEALCNWTKKQLSSWNRMKTDNGHNLSLERISKLHAFDFERFCTRFAVSATHAHPADAAATTAPVSSVRVGNRGTDALTEVDRDKSTINAQRWQEKFESLKRYKELHGDTNVSRKKDEVLSRWCATQRVRCNLTSDRGGAAAAGEVTMSDNKKNPLTRKQFQLLEGIGFSTSAKRKKYDRSVIDKKWEEKYQELVRFKEENGHCDVAVRKGFEHLKQLATWAGLQRQKYRARLSGTKSGRTTEISDEQIMKLGSLGFTFTLQEDFDTRFNQLCQFKKEFGHTRVPVFYTGYNNLGRWATRMRDGIRNSEPWMDEVRKARLLGIDFDISARRVFDHAQKKTSCDDRSEEGDQAVATASTNAQFDDSEFDFYYHDYQQRSL